MYIYLDLLEANQLNFDIIKDVITSAVSISTCLITRNDTMLYENIIYKFLVYCSVNINLNEYNFINKEK